jgi:peptidyl-prolyl cis-trans isomerase-like 1
MQRVTFETSVGEFEVELYSQHCPRTCTNFFQLASIGYYNDTIFHRIIKDFVSLKFLAQKE